MSFFDDMARMFQTFYMRQASSLGDNAKAAFFASANMERTRTPQGRAQRRA